MFLAKSLRSVGINAKSFSYREHPFGYPCDNEKILIKFDYKRNILQKIVINKYSIVVIWSVQKILLLIYATIIYDTFIFISHETFFSNNSDLWILKLFKKKIAFMFVGCPERDPKDFINQTDRGFCSFCVDIAKQKYLNCLNLSKKRKKINFISIYADIIFSQRDTTSFIQDKNKIRKAYIPTDLQIIESAIHDKFKSSEIFIAHIPSNALLKGTASVKKAINDLTEEGYVFHFFSERIKHSEVDAILKKTNILVDQFSPGHGLLSIEGMANGCVVICRTAKWFKEDFPDLPVVSCEPDELKDVLVDLITNPEKMENIALKSFKYFKKYHTMEAVGNYYKKEINLS